MTRVRLPGGGSAGNVAEVDALAGPYLAAAALLVLAGLQKALDPMPLVRATKSVGRPVPPRLVRVVAAGESALGIAALTTASAVAAAGVALSYLAFSGFVLLALAKGGVLASCGCFGKADTPPTRTHATVTASFAVVAAGVASGSFDTPITLPLVAATAAVAATAYLVLAVLPLVQVRA